MKMESAKDQIVYPSMVSNLAARAKTIFAGDLSYFCTEDDLYRLFSPAGTIVNVSIARKSDTSLMYGFVEFESSEKADQITADFNGQMFMGRNLRIFALANYTGPASSFPNNKPESFCVHVSFVTHNLHKLIDEEYLREVFNSFGDVFDVAIRRYYRQRQRQYGYAFVDFLSKQSAITAAESWQEKDHDGVCIKCTLGHRVTGNDDSPPKNSVERGEKPKSSNQSRVHRKDVHYNNNYYNNNQEQEINAYPNKQLPSQTPFPMIPQMMPEMMAYPMPNPMMFPPGSVPPMAMAPHYFAPYNPAPVQPVPFASTNSTSTKASTSDVVFVPSPMMTQSAPMVASSSAIPVQQQFYPYFQNNNFAPAAGSPQTNNLNASQHQMHQFVSSSPGGGSVNSSNTPNANHNPNTISKNISNEIGNNGSYAQYATQPPNYVPSHFVPQQQASATNNNPQYNKNISGNANYSTMNNSSNYPNAGMNIYPGPNFAMQLPPPQYVLPPHQQQQVAYTMPNNPHMYTQPPTVNYT